MPEEVIISVDMQDRYKPNFPGGYDLACSLCALFSDAAAECGVPTWRIFYDSGPDALLSELDQPIFIKNDSSAFSNPFLLPELQRQGVKRINLIGYALGDCVAATAIDAAQKGFEVFVVQDLAFGCPSNIEMRKSDDYRRRVFAALESYFSLGIMLPYPAYVSAAHQLSDQLFRRHIDNIRGLPPVPLETPRHGPFLHDIAQEQVYAAHKLGGLSVRMERAKIMASKRATKTPDYTALKSIQAETTDDIVVRLRLSLRPKSGELIT